MFKKKLLAIITFVFLIISCSSDDDPRDNYPQIKNISFSVTSSDNNRLSDITFTIQGEGIDISDFSSSESHLPITRSYLNQSIAFLTTLDITYRDNSGGEIGVPFIPYTIKLKVSADSETLVEKEVIITESGTTDFVFFTFK
tara:strand:+ start:161 stop:586 length:426 start_codon:yes stop_codon:yes gene_type:complete